MRRTGVVIDRRYQDHQTGPGHPERPERIATLLRIIEGADRRHLHPLEPRSASRGELAMIHDPAHIDRVAATASQPSSAFDADTPVSSDSYRTALLAVGGLLTLIDAIIGDEVDNGFAMVRPPGHHAEADRAMGFCLFNNVAIAAEYLRRRHGLERVLIVDWDVHHGNGTQHSFAYEENVLYLSTHQWPYYPGTGAANEVGRGAGEGTTVNLPLPAGCGDAEYLHLFEHVVDPICRQFQPEFVLISAGFDAHLLDPLAGMQVTEQGFALMARTLLRIAADCARGRCAAVLEGGYSQQALAESVIAVLNEMTEDGPPASFPTASSAEKLVEWIVSIQGRYWNLSH
jgi:acetoin utilization deacetylase AcuC-like enzyme